MSVIYTLVLATEQGTQSIKMEPRAILITGLCIAAGLFVLIFGMWITRPSKQAPFRKEEREPEHKSPFFTFEWPTVRKYMKQHPPPRTES